MDTRSGSASGGADHSSSNSDVGVARLSIALALALSINSEDESPAVDTSHNWGWLRSAIVGASESSMTRRSIFHASSANTIPAEYPTPADSFAA